jgi:TPR repeat protein
MLSPFLKIRGPLTIASILLVVAAAHSLQASPSQETSRGEQKAEDQFQLGRSYARGEGVPQSYEKAGEWYLKAAEAGNTKAMHNLAILYLNGQGTKQDTKEAIHWLQKASESDDPKSLADLGAFYLSGRYVPKDHAKGAKMLEKAASIGEAGALARLADDLLNGDEGFTKDPAKGLSYLRAAADARNPWACGYLGIKYQRGEDLPKDHDKACYWFKIGAYLGDPESQGQYASYLLGKQGPVAAYPWMKLALEDRKCVTAIGLVSEIEPFLTEQQKKDGNAEAQKIKQSYLHGGSVGALKP